MIDIKILLIIFARLIKTKYVAKIKNNNNINVNILMSKFSFLFYGLRLINASLMKAPLAFLLLGHFLEVENLLHFTLEDDYHGSLI